MLRPLATIRTLALLFACFTASQALATDDITFTMSGAGVYCIGASGTVNYTVTGVMLNGGNTMNAQLSDASGSFSVPTTIGTLSTTATTGAIPITFPSVPTGSGYKIRVTSTNTVFNGTPGSSFSINPVLTASASITADPVTSVGAGSVVYFSSTVTNGGTSPSFQWKRNGNNAGIGDSYVLQDAAYGDQIQLEVTPVCANPASALSNTISVTVDPDMTQNNHAWESRKTQIHPTLGFINRRNGSGFTIGSPINKAYVACGTSGIAAYHDDLWEYDPVGDTWTQKATLPGPGRYNAVGFSIDTKGYIGMGLTSSGAVKDFYQYDPSSNSWLQRQSLPPGASVREQAFGFGIGGSFKKGYVGGGTAAGVDLKDFYEFDQSGNNWTAVGTKPDFAGGKRLGAGSFVVGSKGYVVGGFSSSTGLYYNDLYEYNPAGSTWTARASMPGNGRTRPTAFALAGNGYVGMGYSASRYEGTFYQYNVIGNSWTQKPYYPGPTTKTFGVGLTVGNRSFVYKDGTMYEYDLFTLVSFPSKLCSTENVVVDYDATGFIFNAGNVMTPQLSTVPDFSVLTNLTTKTTNTSTGNISVTIPSNLASGNYYFRITASNPPMTTLLETITVTRVETNHIVTAEGGASVCDGVPVTFNSNLTGTGFQWYKNDVAVGSDSPSYTATDLVDQDEIKATKTYTVGCKDPVGITNTPVIVSVRTPAKPTVTLVQPNTLQCSIATAYQWYKGDDLITNAKNQSYQMTEDGVYKVKITDNAGCSTFSADQANVYTGLENDSYNIDVMAYPSPFNESMFLSVADHIVAQGCDFTMMNELGQTVVNKQRAETINRLDLTGKTPGLYILRISFGQTTVIRRLVKMN